MKKNTSYYTLNVWIWKDELKQVTSKNMRAGCITKPFDRKSWSFISLLSTIYSGTNYHSDSVYAHTHAKSILIDLQLLCSALC